MTARLFWRLLYAPDLFRNSKDPAGLFSFLFLAVIRLDAIDAPIFLHGCSVLLKPFRPSFSSFCHFLTFAPFRNKDAQATVKAHIKLLHDYNEIRDIGQGLMGIIADNRGVRVREVYQEFDVGEGD